MPLPDGLARFNRGVTNRITGLVAGRLPGFGVMIHRGRRSGREYRTPLNVFRRDGGFDIALTYGPDRDWVKNVVGAGGAELRYRGQTYKLTNPRVAHGLRATSIPAPVRSILRLLEVDSVLLVDDETAAWALLSKRVDAE